MSHFGQYSRRLFLDEKATERLCLGLRVQETLYRDSLIVRSARSHTKLGSEVMSSGSAGDGAAGTTGDLRRGPEKSREQHHEGLADVSLNDGPLLFRGLFHDVIDIRITKDH